MAKKKGKGLDTRTVIIGVVVILIGLFVWAMVAQGPVGEDEEGLGQMAFRIAGSEDGGGLFAGFRGGGGQCQGKDCCSKGQYFDDKNKKCYCGRPPKSCKVNTKGEGCSPKYNEVCPEYKERRCNRGGCCVWS